MYVPSPELCNDGPDDPQIAQINSKFRIYLYKREYTTAAINAWTLTNTENNESTPYLLPQLVVSSFVVDGVLQPGQQKEYITSFTIQADPNPDIFYEWAIGVELINDATNTSSDTQPTIMFFGEDANFSYDMEGPVELPPITNDYTYNTNLLTVTDYTSAIPRQDQDATVGLEYESLTNPISSGTITDGDILFDFILTNVNNQVTPGLFARVYYGIGLFQLCQIVNVDPADPKHITVQTFMEIPYTGTTTNLAGKNVQFYGGGTIGAGFGPLYANTIEGTEVKRFYTNPEFTQKWIPPFANKFYVFQTEKDYNPGNVEFTSGDSAGQLKYTKFPYYCAEFNEEGEVIGKPVGTPNSQTAWVGQNQTNTDTLPIDNYSYNIYYEEPPMP
jgi:hypothetical protein